jgi:hypothetical protein
MWLRIVAAAIGLACLGLAGLAGWALWAGGWEWRAALLGLVALGLAAEFLAAAARPAPGRWPVVHWFF